ncbi:hypothetical protein KAU11_10760, partial [Candidatus Babeliales bacterium]|nr:hypothetical protein [Candidatus Babeliales bacterium]
AGYRFYWGSAPGDYMNQIDAVTNTVLLDFNALPLPMYAVLTSIDIDGRESTYSTPIDFIKKSYALKAPTNFRELLES